MSGIEERVGPGLYVDGWWGHYSTSQALFRALELGWSPIDALEVEALALTYQASGSLGVSIDDANEARARAGLSAITEDELDDPSLLDELIWALGDAEEWLTEHRAPEGHYFGSHPDASGWGCWAFDAEAA